jgi:hypothetical protein
VGLALAVHLIVLNHGWVQINTQRYMLDYLPIVIVLVGLAGRRLHRALLPGLALYSIGLNLIALYLLPWPKFL